MAQYIVWTALTYSGQKDENDINKFFKEQDWGQIKYIFQFKTRGGQGGSGGRSDVIFKWIAKGQQVGKFSVGRFQMGGISWLGDYIANNSDIVPPQILLKLKMMRDKTGDYGAGSDGELNVSKEIGVWK